MGPKHNDERTGGAIEAKLTVDDLIAEFERFPPTNETYWEVRSNKVAESVDDIDEKSLNILERSTIDSEKSETVRFTAFYTHCTYLRRNKNVTQLKQMLDKYTEFAHRPMYSHTKSMYYSLRGQKGDISRAMLHARRADDELGNHAGVAHNRALTIVSAIEEDEEPKSEKLLSEARDAINRAISNLDYPKYHTTKGRLLALEEQFTEAKEEIRRAIDQEDPDQKSYPIKIGEHQRHLSRVEFAQQNSDIDRRLKSSIQRIEELEAEAEDIIEDLQTQTLQFLGFFATLLAAVITTIQITTQFPPQAAVLLIVTLIGGLLSAFAGLGYLLPTETTQQRSLPMFAVGIILMTIGAGLILL